MFNFSLQYSDAMKIAKKLAHSMSKEAVRYYLNGFYMNKASDGCHYAVSTDGHRLTKIKIFPDYQEQEEGFPDAIFPSIAVKQLEGFKLDRGNQKDKTTVSFLVDKATNTYQLDCCDQSYRGKLIDGTYPDYNRVIPEDYESFDGLYGDMALQAGYLSEIAKAASYDTYSYKFGRFGMRIHMTGDGRPAVITEKDKTILYVLMPMRV